MNITQIHVKRMRPDGAKDDNEEYLEAEGLDLFVPAVEHLLGLEVNHRVDLVDVAVHPALGDHPAGDSLERDVVLQLGGRQLDDGVLQYG